MSNIPLKTIKFPGLDDTYTVPVVDNTLATAGAAADAKKTGDELSELKQDFNQLDATKQDADKPIASAENLNTNVGALDEVPYTMRTAGGSVDIGSQLSMRKVVFGSLVWNQTAEYRTFSGNGITAEMDGTSKLYVHGENTSGSTIWPQFTKTTNVVANHVYMPLVRVKGTLNGTSAIMVKNIFGTFDAQITISSGYGATIVKSTADNNTVYFYKTMADGEEIDARFEIELFDLTAMFGSSQIPDYAYTLNQSTPGTGIAWLKQFIDLDKYHAYCAPHFESTRVSAHKTVGFNQWDEEWELGYWDRNTGLPVTATTTIKNKNPISTLPNTQYYLYAGSGGNDVWRVFYYDANMSFISCDLSSGITNATITTPNNCRYLNFYFSSAYGTTYNHDICINLHWDGSRDGEYAPYTVYNYPLDSTVEGHGIWKLDANNKPYVDGDYMTADGKFHERFGIVDLGTLTWAYLTSGSGVAPFFYAPVSDMVKRTAQEIGSIIPPVICTKYVASTRTASTFNSGNITVDISGTTAQIQIKDDAYTDYATFKTAMSGVYLIYKLATESETESDCDPYTEVQTTDDFGVEYFIDSLYEAGTRDIWIPCGHETLYQRDLKAQLEMSPLSPDLDGTYKWKHEDGINTLVLDEAEVPTPPSENGTYSLKVTVSGSSKTLAWVSDT